MKCFVAIVLLALAAVTLADTKPLEVEESIEPAKAEPVAPEALDNAARNKRGLLLNAAYTAPVAAYSAAYTAPVAYTAPYSYPYAYAYSGYPYYAATYSAPYYVA